MKTGDEKWQALIIEGAKKINVEIKHDIAELFAIHAKELLLWNSKINITAITDPAGIAEKHYIDSAAVAAHIPDNAKLLDIGSGGGFPGIVMKIMNPSIEVLLIEAVRKKANFMANAIRKLGLKNITAKHIRAEELVSKEVNNDDLNNNENSKTDSSTSNSFSIVTSRALTSLAQFHTLALPLLAENGSIIALKGKEAAKEVEELRNLVPDFSEKYEVTIDEYSLPFSRAERAVVSIQPVSV